MAFEITTSSFVQGEMIPTRYTCKGIDLSPELSWHDAPFETKSFALICDDPDAPRGTWVHWVLYNIPNQTKSLPEAVQNVGVSGINDFGKIGYGGPCPPPGLAHRYFFKLYALDYTLSLSPKATKAELEKAMQGHILGKAELIGLYKN